jgi:hypothetical protein
MSKAAAIVLYQVLYQNLAGGIEENEENLRKNDWRPCQDKK